MTSQDYEAPKAVRMDSTATGAGFSFCESGSGDIGDCNSGNSAGNSCYGPGNNPGNDFCESGNGAT